METVIQVLAAEIENCFFWGPDLLLCCVKTYEFVKLDSFVIFSYACGFVESEPVD